MGIWALSTASLRRASLAAILLATVGVAIPLVMMVNGALRLDVDYYTWSWWALPGVWLPSVAAAAAIPRWPAPASVALFLCAMGGLAVFLFEFGWLTFGPIALGSAAIYVNCMREGLRSGTAEVAPTAR